eukprot:m.259334 g.259334  ORF g.259334 m.259334 type:complete len:341 (-) comp22392_c0_seq1:82-1104(-)
MSGPAAADGTYAESCHDYEAGNSMNTHKAALQRDGRAWQGATRGAGAKAMYVPLADLSAGAGIKGRLPRHTRGGPHTRAPAVCVARPAPARLHPGRRQHPPASPLAQAPETRRRLLAGPHGSRQPLACAPPPQTRAGHPQGLPATAAQSLLPALRHRVPRPDHPNACSRWQWHPLHVWPRVDPLASHPEPALQPCLEGRHPPCRYLRPRSPTGATAAGWAAARASEEGAAWGPGRGLGRLEACASGARGPRAARALACMRRAAHRVRRPSCHACAAARHPRLRPCPHSGPAPQRPSGGRPAPLLPPRPARSALSPRAAGPRAQSRGCRPAARRPRPQAPR